MYLLDANVFISAKNLHYGFDFCPAFWDWIVVKNTKGDVFSVDKVFDEIAAGNDELTTWASGIGAGLFRKTDTSVIEYFQQINDWAILQQYQQGAINTFLQAADYYLIAHALLEKATVVTHEVPRPTLRQIKIPNACIGLEVQFTTPYQMLRHEHATFVLGERPTHDIHY